MKKKKREKSINIAGDIIWMKGMEDIINLKLDDNKNKIKTIDNEYSSNASTSIISEDDRNKNPVDFSFKNKKNNPNIISNNYNNFKKNSPNENNKLDKSSELNKSEYNDPKDKEDYLNVHKMYINLDNIEKELETDEFELNQEDIKINDINSVTRDFNIVSVNLFLINLNLG